MADPRNVLCPKCWKRDPDLTICGECGEGGCDACLESLGGVPMCDDCRDGRHDEKAPTCPTCGHADGFREIEYETETGSEMCLTCNACGAKTDDAEISAMETAK